MKYFRIAKTASTGTTLFILLSAFAVWTPAVHAGDEASPIEVDPQPLAAALNSLSAQSGLQFAYVTTVANGIESPGTSGTKSPADALDSMLAGTGLTYSYINDTTVAIAVAEERDEDTEPGKQKPASSLVLMAQNQASAQKIQTRSSGEITNEEHEDARPLEEIVVTGSHIRGVGISIGSKVVTIDRQEIDRAGFGTTEQIMRSVPQNFKGGINEDTVSSANDSNPSGGTSINLRGLGPGSTLTLLNGRRIPNGGTTGSFADISNIPATAIDRVDVLPDGASAVYGSDAIAGVVNFVLRTDYEGAETRLRLGTVTEGASDELQFSQIFGKSWDTGHAFLSYEYHQRDSLGREEKPYSASADLRPLGGDDFRIDFSVPGNILDPATGFTTVASAIPGGQDGTNLAPGDLQAGSVNLFNANSARNLLKDQERHSAYLAVSQRIDDKVELYAEGGYSEREYDDRPGTGNLTLQVPSTNPFFVDPFGGSTEVRLRYNWLADFSGSPIGGESRAYSAALGTNVDLTDSWGLQFYGAYNNEKLSRNTGSLDFGALNAALADSNPNTAFNPFGDGSFQQNPATMQSILVPRSFTTTADVLSVNAVVDGKLFRLSGGDVRAAFGASHTEFSFDRLNNEFGVITEQEYERKAVATFGEIIVPIVGEGNSRPGLGRLIFTASLRYEDYDDVGDTTNPKYGLLWTPTEGLDIRATWGTSFRAPDLRELDEAANRNFFRLMSDPLSPTGSTLSLLQIGNNSGLASETADTWTVGFDFSPPSAPELNFGVTYYKIEFKDRINSVISSFSTVLVEDERFAPAIIRNPTQPQIDAICESSVRFLSGDLDTCRTTPLGAIIDMRLINASVTETDGVDFDIHYWIETNAASRWDFQLSGTYILNFDEAFGPTAPIVELVDTFRNPIGLRLRNSVGWNNQNGFAATAYINYSDSYTDNISTPNRNIDSWTTVDLTLAYDTGNSSGRRVLNDSVFSLSVSNLFDTDPPFVNNTRGIGYDPENASPLGRFISFNITKKW